MNQTFGCIIMQKEKRLFFKDKISKLISEIGLKILSKSSESYQIKDYLFSNQLNENEILSFEIDDMFILLGHPIYFLMNKEILRKLSQTKRTLFHFSQHGKSKEYGYKYYLKGELCTHEVCFGKNHDLYQRSWIQNDVKLPQYIYREDALNHFAHEKQIPIELFNTLRLSLPRKGMSSLFFHSEKQKWVYGKQIIDVSSDEVKTNFQELAPQGHKRGKPLSIDSEALEKGLLIRWEQFFYEWHHRTIKEILGFRFDYPAELPENTKLTKYEALTQEV